MSNKPHAATWPKEMKITELIKKKDIPYMCLKGSLPISGPHQEQPEPIL
jgi:hypothetical protein